MTSCPRYRINNIRTQGYFDQTDQEVASLALGNRFAYSLCLSIVVVGTALGNVPLLAAMTVVAFFGVVLPNHPFDYLYNYGLRQMLGRPKLPRRSPQLKFACTVATLWLGATVFAFYSGAMTAGYILGGSLAVIAFLVSVFDFCIPSIVYNFLFRVQVPRG